MAGHTILVRLQTNFIIDYYEKKGRRKMKKKWLIILMLFFLSGCVAISDLTNTTFNQSQTTTTFDLSETTTTFDQSETTLSSGSGFFNDSVSEFIEKYELVVEKIDEMVSEMMGENTETTSLSHKTPMLKLSEIDPGTIYYPEDFMEVYNNQTLVIDSTLSMDFIFEYQLILEEIQSSCDFDNLVLEETQIVDSESFGTLSVTFYNVLDGHIIIHYISADMDQFLKIGFDEAGLFHLVFFQYVIYENQLDYNYEEFLEGDHLTVINSLEGDWITYTCYDFSVGKQSSYSLHNGEENIIFYDLQNKTEFFYKFISGVLDAQNVGFSNDNDFTIGYEEGGYIPEGLVQIRWQMLEATGWDYVIVQNMEASNIQEGDGIFKDEQNLYVYGDDQLNVDLNPMFANIRLAKMYEKSELTDQILNLSSYGLTFSFNEISVDLINQTLEDGLQMVDEKITYNNVYFRSETVKQDVLTLLDPDIRSLIYFLSNNE